MAPKNRKQAVHSRKNHLTLVKPHYTLCYGMRLDKGTAPEHRHPHVPVLLPDGSQGSMALHVMNGTVDDIKAQLLQSIEAFFEIYGE